jgi:ATP-dependent Lhr-like helicase
MNLPPSSSEASSSFDLLDERIQKWIWQKGWTELRDAQEQAIPLLVNPGRDVIVAAATASGKTEAAFLPILTRLVANDSPRLALYVSPLKALINDQWARLSELCDQLEVLVTPWHGDVNDSRKRRFLRRPSGCLLITPESLEGLLMRDGHSLPKLFEALEYVVVDELHAFIGDERGKQLQSLLHRIEVALARRVVRVGLSATLGEMRLAAEFLRPTAGNHVVVLESRDSSRELKLIVKGIDEAPGDGAAGNGAPESARGGMWAVADDLFKLRGSNNLVFPNSRRNVEVLADRLREQCAADGLPNEFWPHHGSLSKQLREELEKELKDGQRPVTAIATTTLELGIDIGAVKSVAQVGSAPSVASLRQRLGRSGRRAGDPAILRCYSIEAKLDANSALSDLLREGLVETTAQIQLLVRGWYEPPETNALHLSTLVQQLLSLIAQYGGLRAADAWNALYGSGVFTGLQVQEFADLLRELGARGLLQQESSGLLLHGPRGEQIVNHYTFLAAFVGDEEFRIVTKGETLGSLPVSRPLTLGSYIIFAGRRWCVLRCDQTEKLIEVEAARAGQVPKFDGSGGRAHDEVRITMRRILSDPEPLPFLDATANRMLSEARDNYDRLDLSAKRVIQNGKEIHVITWRGDVVNDTLAVWLRSLGLDASNEGLSVMLFDTSRNRVIDALEDIGELPLSRREELAALASNPIEEKWDWTLPDSLLRKGYGYRHFDPEGVQRLCREIAGLEP